MPSSATVPRDPTDQPLLTSLLVASPRLQMEPDTQKPGAVITHLLVESLRLQVEFQPEPVPSLAPSAVKC